jgi:metal-responsive CopG/Arc/MetJ family transcriptional regulator
MRTIAITIEEETLDRVDRLVAGRGAGIPTNRSKVIRTAVHEYLTRLDRASEEARERDVLHRHARRLARAAAALVKQQAKP